MHELATAVAEIRGRDGRFSVDGYFFVFEALHYAHNVLGIGEARDDENLVENLVEDAVEDAAEDAAQESDEESTTDERHLTGQQLCEAIRLYALERYGYMAMCVLNNWGISCTGDFGEIVFNLIEAKQMRKTPSDRREDFDDVYDFEAGLNQSFKITMPDG